MAGVMRMQKSFNICEAWRVALLVEGASAQAARAHLVAGKYATYYKAGAVASHRIAIFASDAPKCLLS